MRWGSADFKRLKQLQKQLQRYADIDVDAFARQVVNELGNRLLAKTKKKTPVDSGHLRRNWFISKVVKKGDWYELEVYNNVDYAPFVENGHRIVGKNGATLGWKEGKFMLRLSVQELERMLPALLEKRTQELLKGLFEDGH